jgi:Alternative complex III, ActD subunit
MDINEDTRVGVYGLMAEFETPEDLLDATRRAYADGYRDMDAYTPFPVSGVAEALGSRRTWVSTMVGICGLLGAVGGFGLMYWITVIAYPVNVAGRPLNSWPAYIPITFECAVLLASLSAVIGMFAMCGLPMPYHPTFNVPRFGLASKNRFFLCIEARDGRFRLDATRDFLQGLAGVQEVSEVAP